MGTRTPENSLLLADMTDERRYAYTPHEFLEANARLYTRMICNRMATGTVIKVTDDNYWDLRLGLAHFESALNYPTDPRLADELRLIGDAARLDLQDALEMQQADLTMPGMQQTVFHLLGIEGLMLKVKYDLVREGGIEDLRQALFE